MLDEKDESKTTEEKSAQPRVRTRRRAAGRPAGPPDTETGASGSDLSALPVATDEVPAKDEVPVKKDEESVAKNEAPVKKAAKRSAKKAESPKSESAEPRKTQQTSHAATFTAAQIPFETPQAKLPEEAKSAPAVASDKVGRVGGLVLFQAPDTSLAPPRQKTKTSEDDHEPNGSGGEHSDEHHSDDGDDGPKRRRRSRGGRRRSRGAGDETDPDDNGGASDHGADESGKTTQGKSAQQDASSNAAQQDAADQQSSADSEPGDGDESDEASGTRRRRRRRRAGEESNASPDDPENTVIKVREGRTAEDEITSVAGSTRLEAKKQRRREGREAGRRRAPIISEAEFLARRESVKREMVVRQKSDYTQIAVLEDSVLVEHYVARESQVSIIGNVYLGKVQNVLPSMEAAFVDIGAGRNAVLYAGEVDWSTLENGKQRKIEDVLTPGQIILVQATKDPVGQKGARLTSQISLPGRFLVYVPQGQTNGISRKLPDTERARLKALLKEVLPENAGVIVRTAAEGATEEQLRRDVTALTARWEDIERKVEGGQAPELLYSEPDLMIKVVRDLFNEDFTSLVVDGPDAWDNIHAYINHVAPDLSDRLSRWEDAEQDAFTFYRLDEQIHKALERKVFLPSGGSLIIDRTEAMTVVDVNTGKFTGSGGNLEETVTKNNLEAAEEIVRQLRLRDIGGIIVVDFIDMVLESNRDLVLRRLVECLGRDRTRHQVAEVTSLGLVQMTRKRIGTGLLESFSVDCEHCKGRGVVISEDPVEPKKDESRRTRRSGRGRNDHGGKNDHSSKADNASSDAKMAEKAPESADPEVAPGSDQKPDEKSVSDPVLTREGDAP